MARARGRAGGKGAVNDRRRPEERPRRVHPPETLPRRSACIPRLEVVVAIEGTPVVRIVAATAEDEEAMRAWAATVPLLAPLLEAA